NCLNTNGVLVTYSAKGIVKRNLRSAGFTVKLLVCQHGKRHILRAIKE
ncbi:MAG: MnmC family methyltransferase, partial [Bacteroidales bacterium]|nr:MnmC family methyltransferase [Bacteroidales bacterium]